MSWQPPKDDGGSPLTVYHIEMKEVRDRTWSKVDKIQPDITTYCVQRLKTNAEYVFRVMAVNEVGVSEPLNSETVIPKSAFGKHTFVSFFLHTIE